MRRHLFTITLLVGLIFSIHRAQAAYLSGSTPIIGNYLRLPGSPYAFYGNERLYGWTGNDVIIQRGSDSAQMDLGFNAQGFIDMATANTWANGSLITAILWHDQTGHNRDAPASAMLPIYTTAHAPVIVPGNAINGLQPISMVGANGSTLTEGYLALPNFSLTMNSMSVYVVAAVQTGWFFNGYGLIGFGTDNTPQNDVTLYTSDQGMTYYWTNSVGANQDGFPYGSQMMVVGIIQSRTSSILRQNGHITSKAAAAGTTLLGGQIGGGSWSILNLGNTDIFAVAVYDGPLTAADATATETVLADPQNFNVNMTQTEGAFIRGDSIEAGTACNNYLQNILRYLQPLIPSNVAVYNGGISGQTAATMYANRAGNDASHYNPSFTKNAFLFAGGTNDIDQAISGAIVGVGTTVYNSYIVPYTQYMFGLGFTGGAVATLLPRAWTGSATDVMQKQAEWVILNNLIVNGAVTNNYKVSDRAGISAWSSNLSNYTGARSCDGIHPTAASAQLIAPVDAAALLSIL